MKIADRIALSVLEEIEAKTWKNFTKKDYLELEDLVSCTIRTELNKWLGFDTDLQTFEDGDDK